MTLERWGNTNLGPTRHNNNDWEMFSIAGKNLIRSLIDRAGVWSAGQDDWWGEAYVSAGGREASVDANLISAEFDTNKYKIPDIAIIIEASSISAVADFAINDCSIINVDTGKWVLTCDTGTDEVKRAQLYKTLFFGTDGTDARASNTYITSITKLGTTIARDIGKQAHYASISSISAVGVADEENYLGTFADTSTNTDSSFWSNTFSNSVFVDVDTFFPDGTAIIANPGDATTNEIGTDTTADEDDNPADCKLLIDDDTGVGATQYGIAQAIIICKGDISWAESGSDFTYSNTDFLTDNSIPVFTDGRLDIVSLIYHTIPTGTFSATISTSFGTQIFEDWETGVNVQYKLTGTAGAEDTGWLEADELSTFTAFTAEPDTLIVKLIPKTTSPTVGYPSLRGVAVRGN